MHSDYPRLGLTWSHATLTLALLLLEVEVTLNQITSLKSKFQRGRGSNTSRTDSSTQITLTGEQIPGRTTQRQHAISTLRHQPFGFGTLRTNNQLHPRRHITKGKLQNTPQQRQFQIPQCLQHGSTSIHKKTIEHSSTSRFYLEIKETKLSLWRIIQKPRPCFKRK